MVSISNVFFLLFILCHLISAETSFHIGIHRQYGWHNICVNGASQLCSLCAFLCVTGTIFHAYEILFLSIFSKIGILFSFSYFILCGPLKINFSPLISTKGIISLPCIYINLLTISSESSKFCPSNDDMTVSPILIGSCIGILCNLLLSWWICWAEIPFIGFDLFDTEMLWQVMMTCMHIIFSSYFFFLLIFGSRIGTETGIT